MTRKLNIIKPPLMILLLAALCSVLSSQADVAIRYHKPLPSLNWQHNPGQPLFATEALKGGTYRQAMAYQPLTLRRIGPGTDNQMASLLNQMQLPLLARQPSQHLHRQQGELSSSPSEAFSTEDLVSVLCSHWAVQQDPAQFFCRLDKNALWSDGVAVTTADIAFTVEFILADSTAAITQKNTLERFIKQPTVYSEREFSFTLNVPFTNDHLNRVIAFRPLARHFYQSQSGWPTSFDFKAEPSTSAYYIDRLSSYGRVTLLKTNHWWAADKPFFKHRFNVDRVIYQQVPDAEALLQRFAAGEVDAITLQKESNWQSVRMRQLHRDQKINLIAFYHQGLTRYSGLVLNKKYPELSSRQVRRQLIRSFSEAILPATTMNFTLLYSNPSDRQQFQPLIAAAADSGFILDPLQISHADLLKKLETENYQLAWLALEGTPDNPFGRVLGTRPGRKKVQMGVDDFLFFAGISRPYSRYAAWQWVRLPEAIGTRISADILDPFDPVTGGVFWIDPAERAAILANPMRSSQEKTSVELLINEKYKL